MYGPFMFCGGNRITIGGVIGGGIIAGLINGMYGPAPIIPGDEGGNPNCCCGVPFDGVGSSNLRILPESRQNGERFTLKKNMNGWSTMKLGVFMSNNMGFAGTIRPCVFSLIIDL